MISITEISIALVIGGGTGLILQRGRVCANTGFRNMLLSKNVEIAGIFLLAVAVEMIGYLLFANALMHNIGSSLFLMENYSNKICPDCEPIDRCSILSNYMLQHPRLFQWWGHLSEDGLCSLRPLPHR